MSFHHGENLVNRGGRRIREVMDGIPGTATVCGPTDDLDNGAHLPLNVDDERQASVKANRKNLYWKSSVLFSKVKTWRKASLCTPQTGYIVLSNRLFSMRPNRGGCPTVPAGNESRD